MVFLDANPVIYLIEQPAAFDTKVRARATAVLAGGERLAVSDLVGMECLVGPLKVNNLVLLAQYVTFFLSPAVSVLTVSSASGKRYKALARGHDIQVPSVPVKKPKASGPGGLC